MNEITIYQKMNNPLEAVETLGRTFAKSGMFGVSNVEQGQVLALACMAENKNPMEISRVYHVIDGRLSMRSDAMLAEYMKLGGKVRWKRFDAEAAVATWAYDGQEIDISYTAQDAKEGGYLPAKPKSGWAKDPAAMLRARLISKAVRMLAPQVCAGYYTPEEVADFEPQRPAYVEPAATVETAPAPDAEADDLQFEDPLAGVNDEQMAVALQQWVDVHAADSEADPAQVLLEVLTATDARIGQAKEKPVDCSWFTNPPAAKAAARSEILRATGHST